jgi:hypothetical protein
MLRAIVTGFLGLLLCGAAASGEAAEPPAGDGALKAKLAALGDNSWVNLGLGLRGGQEVPAVFDQANGLFFKYGGCCDATPPVKISFPKGDPRHPNGYSNSCWAVDVKAGQWRQIREYDCSWPTDRPANGCSRMYAYDSKRALIWMYCGISDGGGGGNNYDLWTYDGAKDTFKQWNAANPAKLKSDSAPGCVFVYDSAHDLLIMPWGETTRVYDPNKNAWEDRKTPGGPPPPGHYGNMVFEPVKKRVIYPVGMKTGKWQEGKERPASTPTAVWRGGKRQVEGKTVRGSEEYAFSTWAFDVEASSWRKLELKPEEQPSPRWRFGITWDALNKVVLLVAGSSDTWDDKEEYRNDVWAFDPAADKWTEMKAAGGPPVHDRECRHCAYDEADNAVLFLTAKAGLWAYRYKKGAGR